MIRSIDHIVLTSSDIDKTVHFYCSVLGMKLDRFTPADGSPERLTLCFGAQKINLHRAESPYIPHARNPVSGAVDICFLSDIPVDEWAERLTGQEIAIEDGPVQKIGATGPLTSIYVRDPDGNLIEISNLNL